MITGTLLFVLGVLLLQLQAELPSVFWVILLPLVLYSIYRFPRFRFFLIPITGFFWALCYAFILMGQGIAPELEGKGLYLEGVIASLPQHTVERTRFEFHVERMIVDGEELPPPGRIRLGWFRSAPRISVGDHWALEVRLKRPHGLMNPGGFDYETWLFQKGIRATGYVINSSNNRRLATSSPVYAVHLLRQKIRDLVNVTVQEPNAAAMLNALLIGDRSALKPEHWELFSATGTSHLIAISGLHIGIIAGLTFFLMRRVWTLSETAINLLPAPLAAAISALVTASIYSAMAGFAIPTQRALIMLLVFTLGFLWRRHVRPLHSLSAAMLLVVLIDPTSVLSAGFWLSFAAVSAILYGMTGRTGKNSLLRQWGVLQWLIALALVPVLLVHGMQISLLAPLVNLIAVPLFSLLMVPLALFSLLLLFVVESAGEPLMQLTGWMLVTFLDCLRLVSDLPLATWNGPHLPLWIWPSVVLGVIIILAPVSVPGRWLGMVFMLPLFILKPEAPEYGALRITVLDVGQGLSVVIRTRHHLLVYDLGPGYASGFNAGSAVVLPYLRHSGVRSIDRLIISHGDLDHSGGLAGLRGKIKINGIVSGEPERLDIGTSRCVAGETWVWDGVQFMFIHPDKDKRWRGNNFSCVLMVEAGGRRILIPGDIHERVEQVLVSRDSNFLKSDVVLIPHHGSKTSSSINFVKAVSPKYAISAAGYRNRYGFPDTGVIQRWQESGAKTITNSETGAVVFEILANGTISRPIFYRQKARHYWHFSP